MGYLAHFYLPIIKFLLPNIYVFYDCDIQMFSIVLERQYLIQVLVLFHKF